MVNTPVCTVLLRLRTFENSCIHIRVPFYTLRKNRPSPQKATFWVAQ